MRSRRAQQSRQGRISQAHFDEAVTGQMSHSSFPLSGSATFDRYDFRQFGWSYSELEISITALSTSRKVRSDHRKRSFRLFGLLVYGSRQFLFGTTRIWPCRGSCPKHARSRRCAEKRANNHRCLNTLAEVMLRTHRLSEAKRYNQEALKIEDSGSDTFGLPIR